MFLLGRDKEIQIELEQMDHDSATDSHNAFAFFHGTETPDTLTIQEKALGKPDLALRK